MQGFSYEAPASVDAAVALLSECKAQGRRAQCMAGGTDLIVQMRLVDDTPRTIVDIKKIPETRELRVDAQGVFIGAAVSASEITAREDLRALLPGLVEATHLIGSTQIQGRATPCGNLCNASPAGDTIPAMIASRGVARIAGPGGHRELPVEAFVVGVGQNALADDELLLGVEFPAPLAGTADAYLRFIPRTEMDIAVAGAGVSVTLDGSGTCTAARVAIGAVAPTALLVPAAAEALIGTRLDDDAIRAAGEASTAASSPISDKRGTAEFRRKIVAVLTRRAAGIAKQRAQEKAA